VFNRFPRVCVKRFRVRARENATSGFFGEITSGNTRPKTDIAEIQNYIQFEVSLPHASSTPAK
jgi:hypothetical protein